MKRRNLPASVLSFGLIAAVSVLSTAWASTANTTEANITRVTTGMLEQSQFSHHTLDRELAGKFLDSYLDALDGTHSLFLASDLAEFAPYRATLAQATRQSGDTTAARTIFKRYLQRAEERTAYATELLKTANFDFSAQERFSLDREKAERPRDLAAAHALWERQLRAEYLQEKLTDTPPAQIASKLTRRYETQLKVVKGLNEEDVLETYLNALAHVYDPHSDYLGRSQLESFSITMNLSLFGIGAVLENSDGYCTIRELVPGGPAARSSALTPGDRIVAVAQDKKEPTDVLNMPLSRIVELIRGPKGTLVTLTILPSGAADGSLPKLVKLVRDEIKLEDQQAKARVLDLKVGGPKAPPLRVGVIDIPSFYANMMGRGEAKPRSVTADVAQLVTKLKTENVQGIVLDLRQNGGGSLKEAISLTGLFFAKGPVVQTRGSDGKVEVESDPDPSVLYDGPLVVLTSRFSASASEILAGALQDYGRAVIVGDSQTFGKGTVQTIVPLAPIMKENGLAHAYDPGAVKITVGKFYRPGGASTQLRGVTSDIVLPSISDFDDVNESALDNPLPWDAVPSTKYEPLNRAKPFVEALRAKSAQRIAARKDFSELSAEVARLKKNMADKTVSLNEAERRKEMGEAKARREQREKEREKLRAAQPVTYEVTLKNVATPGLERQKPAKPAPDPKKGKAKDDPNSRSSAQDLASDIILDESVLILADYTELLRASKAAP
ncbi:MAG TPA: carboxy terminal-processing peptidase [Polyangiales bacterium]|nr:carboxy terminal-processing peptidase [Polyangiales bacterium]